MFYRYPVILLVTAGLLAACQDRPDTGAQAVSRAEMNVPKSITQQDTMNKKTDDQWEVVKSEEEWKEQLTSKEFRILRNGGTEMPYINEYWDNKEEGVYYCAACGQPLYSSEHKYKSGTGWPSFWKPIDDEAVAEKADSSYFMVRTEIVCSRCGSHLGHVFEDGPDPTGLRYCMNSAALDFEEKDMPEDSTDSR